MHSRGQATYLIGEDDKFFAEERLVVAGLEGVLLGSLGLRAAFSGVLFGAAAVAFARGDLLLGDFPPGHVLAAVLAAGSAVVRLGSFEFTSSSAGAITFSGSTAVCFDFGASSATIAVPGGSPLVRGFGGVSAFSGSPVSSVVRSSVGAKFEVQGRAVTISFPGKASKLLLLLHCRGSFSPEKKKMWVRNLRIHVSSLWTDFG